MIVSELKLFNFRRFQSVDGNPGLTIHFHKGLNALIGENDSGKTAVIDALKIVLLTQSNEYIRVTDDDFYTDDDGNISSEFKIDCTLTEFTPNEAKNFIEYLSFDNSDDEIKYKHIFWYPKMNKFDVSPLFLAIPFGVSRAVYSGTAPMTEIQKNMRGYIYPNNLLSPWRMFSGRCIGCRCTFVPSACHRAERSKRNEDAQDVTASC